MKIAIGCDHGAFELKQEIMRYLDDKGIAYQDFGCHSTASMDYPDVAFPVAQAVAAGQCDRGILLCGTGIGMCIAANKVTGVRAALCHDTFSAHATREHNDSNILTMGARVVGVGLALDIVDIWLHTGFQGGRHATRIGKIAQNER